MTDLVRVLQAALSQDEAAGPSRRLESAYFPNQVLLPGSDALAEELFAGLASATGLGAFETWLILGQLAAGACGPTAALPEIVAAVQEALLRHADVVIRRLRSADPEPFDLLVVDVADAMLVYVGAEFRAECLSALKSFATRGPKERAAVSLIPEVAAE